MIESGYNTFAIGNPTHNPFPILKPLYRTKAKKLDLRKKISDFVYKGIRLSYQREQGILLEFDINSGAGIIGGKTAFLAFYCKGRGIGHKNMYVRFPIQVGLTENANCVPYPY